MVATAPSVDLNEAFSTGTEPMGNLTSTDWREVYAASETLFFQSLHAMADDERPESFFGLSAGEVKALYKQKRDATTQASSQWVLREGLEDLSTNEIAALGHLENVRGLLRMNAHIAADRNQQNEHHGGDHFDRETRRTKATEDVRAMKALGWGEDDIREFYNNVKLWLTNTPHPTKDKNDRGEALFRGLTSIAENSDPDERDQAVQDIISRMLVEPLTPREKDTLPKETEDGLNDLETYNEGMLNWLEDQQDALDEIFEPGVIDLTDANMNIDIAGRDWRSGDADGKPVPAAVLFGKRVRSAYKAIQCYIDILEDHPELSDVVDVYKKFRDNVGKLYERIDQIEALSSSDPAFDATKEEFSQAFRDIEFKGEEFTSGSELTKAMMGDLRERFSSGELSKEASKAARRAVLRHKQLGMSMVRQEIRHNGEDIDAIFDNLFTLLKTKGIKIPDNVKSLDDLQPAAQAKFFNHLMRKHKNEIKDWLFEANPGNSGDDKEDWLREVLERFEVVKTSYNQNRLGAGIIAEARPMSAVKQQIIAEAFGIKNMVHVALNEDEESIRMAAENLALYSKVFGQKNLDVRLQKVEASNKSTQYFYCVMDPQSDSHKGYGALMKGQQRDTKRDLIKQAIKSAIAIHTKLGTGASYARGGFSPKAVPRLFLYALSSIKDIPVESRGILKQMASYVSTTIQGRDVGFRLGTPAQAYDMIGGVIEEMQGACLAIDGKINPAELAPQAVKYSTSMRYVLQRLEQEARDGYHDMRTLQSLSHLGTKRADNYADEVSAGKMAEYTNTGARKDVRDPAQKKSKGVVKKALTKLRAIGSNAVNVNTDNFYDGSYMVGSFMRGLHEAYQNKEVTKQDLLDFQDDKFYWQHVLPNVFASLASADYQSGSDRLSQGKKSITAGEIKEGAKVDFKGMRENKAFHAVLAHDAMMATAYTEALLCMEKPAPLAKIRKLFDRVRHRPPVRKGFDLSHDEIMDRNYAPDDPLKKMSCGWRTKNAFTDIEDTEIMRDESRLMRAMLHEMERRINAGDIDPEADANKSLLHHMACAHRTQATPIGAGYLLDKSGFGSRPNSKPVFDTLYDNHPALSSDVVQDIEHLEASNDNN